VLSNVALLDQEPAPPTGGACPRCAAGRAAKSTHDVTARPRGPASTVKTGRDLLRDPATRLGDAHDDRHEVKVYDPAHQRRALPPLLPEHRQLLPEHRQRL
jgi:hypothetical protein